MAARSQPPGRPGHPPVWLFAFAALPYGVVGSYAGQVMPYLVRHSKLDVDSIGWYSLILLIPPMLQFLYAPIVDIGLRRKHWHVLITLISAAALVGTCLVPVATYPTEYMIFAVIAQLISGLVGSCNGGLLATTMPDEVRGQAGAWLNVGNLSGGAVSAAIAIYMIGHEIAPIYIGLALAAMMVLPSLAVLAIVEPRRPAVHVKTVFGDTLRDVNKELFSRAGFTGVLLCLSPVGTAALTNYFSGMATSYHASDDLIALMTGPAQGGLTAVGALIGGVLCDRYNRRKMYLLGGVLIAMVGFAMALAPVVEVTYVWGVICYALFTGICYSAFTAMVLETIGVGGIAAATQYTLFMAAGNTAINYVGFIDSRFDKAYGVQGVTAADAALNAIGVLVIGLVFWRTGSFKRRSSDLG
ncbi:MAG: MFS transporter [Proteobacteria bacterium]|nr:MFS transporter [Pseudomonadota bacterium]